MFVEAYPILALGVMYMILYLILDFFRNRGFLK